jgi:hypothetical protein
LVCKGGERVYCGKADKGRKLVQAAIAKEILPFAEGFAANNPTWISPGLNININVGPQKKSRRFGVKGLLWEYMMARKRLRSH